MTAPQRVPLPESNEDLQLRAHEQAEAEAAVAAVMQREEAKAAAIAAMAKPQRRPALKPLLLVALVAFNLYAWIGNPPWLRVPAAPLPQPSYYTSSWKIAVFLQRQRIEEYRAAKGHLPQSASQAGPPVNGVSYTPIQRLAYDLMAGEGESRFVYHSRDTLSARVTRAFMEMALLTGGYR
jgi:hypothetical protein